MPADRLIADTMTQTLPGPDGRPRCRWCAATPGYLAYHDSEWGFPVHDDRRLFEKLCLEGFQSGLSWRTILEKRDNFRAAFDGFDFERVARYTTRDVTRLLGDAGIVRNRRKIEMAVTNARATIGLRDAGIDLGELVWSFRPADPAAGSDAPADAPSQSAESRELAKTLKKAGFVYVGPVTTYALMEAIGILEHRT